MSLPDHILDEITKDNLTEWIHWNTPYVDRASTLRMNLSSSPHSRLRIADLSNAFRAGEVCIQYAVEAPGEHLPVEMIFETGSLRALFDLLATLEWTKGQWGYEGQSLTARGIIYTVTRENRPSKRVFSPLHLQRLKPLSEEPAKWTIPHCLRAIANGQFTDLRCNGVYTDDYAFDAAVDFRKGEIRSPLALVQRITESASGWRCYRHDDRVSLNCHTFDMNSFRFQVEPAAGSRPVPRTLPPPIPTPSSSPFAASGPSRCSTEGKTTT